MLWLRNQSNVERYKRQAEVGVSNNVSPKKLKKLKFKKKSQRPIGLPPGIPLNFFFVDKSENLSRYPWHIASTS